MKVDYLSFDCAIWAAVKGGATRLSVIYRDRTVSDEYQKLRSSSKGGVERAVDKRLQALKKRHRLVYSSSFGWAALGSLGNAK